MKREIVGYLTHKDARSVVERFTCYTCWQILNGLASFVDLNRTTYVANEVTTKYASIFSYLISGSLFYIYGIVLEE